MWCDTEKLTKVIPAGCERSEPTAGAARLASTLAWEGGNATAKDCAADSLGILWILVSAVKATPVKI